MTQDMFRKLQEISYLLVTEGKVWPEHTNALQKMLEVLEFNIEEAKKDKEKIKRVLDKINKKETV